jgi:hypothetical protein
VWALVLGSSGSLSLKVGGRGGWRKRVGHARHVIDIPLGSSSPNILRKLYSKLPRIAHRLPTEKTPF